MGLIKTAVEIELMARAGRLLSGILKQIVNEVKPGVSTLALDRRAADQIRQAGAEPAFLNYRGYPAVLCASVNNRVVHGIPKAAEVLTEGDIVGLDLGLKLNGWYADMAMTVGVGRIDQATAQFIQSAQNALQLAIKEIKPGRPLGAVSAAIQAFVETRGYGVVRDLTGHGIGAELHEPPVVSNYGSPSSGPILQAGMVLAIEPMITLGGWQVRTLPDSWGIETVDGSLSAHFEHTVAITESGSRILTV